jgi:hypothetical protein
MKEGVFLPVSQSLYSSSIEGWRRYENVLGDLHHYFVAQAIPL